MNRFRKEERRKRAVKNTGLSEDQLASLKAEELIEEKILALAHELHAEDFPEEYDHIYDSGADAKDRARGIKPMSAEYIAEVQARRAARGVSPLDSSGNPRSDDSFQRCLANARPRQGSGICK